MKERKGERNCEGGERERERKVRVRGKGERILTEKRVKCITKRDTIVREGGKL